MEGGHLIGSRLIEVGLYVHFVLYPFLFYVKFGLFCHCTMIVCLMMSVIEDKLEVYLTMDKMTLNHNVWIKIGWYITTRIYWSFSGDFY